MMQNLKKLGPALKKMTPELKLKVMSITFVIFAVLMFLLTFSSLALMASNLMITNQLSTPQYFQTLSEDHPLYLVSQRMIIAFDVLCMVILVVLCFSVFNFYTKGNLIIIVINIVLQVLRQISSIMFLAGNSSLRESWNNLWIASQQGQGESCFVQTCDSKLNHSLNYVVCAKLSLWKQTYSFELGFAIASVFFVSITLFLAFKTNKLDVKIVQFKEQVLQ